VGVSPRLTTRCRADGVACWSTRRRLNAISRSHCPRRARRPVPGGRWRADVRLRTTMTSRVIAMARRSGHTRRGEIRLLWV
jgi:hypothetical protein